MSSLKNLLLVMISLNLSLSLLFLLYLFLLRRRKSVCNEMQTHWSGISRPWVEQPNSNKNITSNTRLSNNVKGNLEECFEQYLLSNTNSFNESNIEQCPTTISNQLVDSCKTCSVHSFCKDILQKKENCDIEDINTHINSIKHKILILSSKEGVGKTTFACNMAILLANEGYKVGILDLDIKGSSVKDLMSLEDKGIYLTTWLWKPLVHSCFDIKVTSVAQFEPNEFQDSVPPGSPPLPNQRKRNFIRRVLKDVKWGELDFLLCDFPSGTNDELLTLLRMFRQIKPDGAVIMSNPQRQSHDALRKSITFCHKTNINIIGIVENMRLCKCQIKDKNEKELKKLYEKNAVEQIALEMHVLYLGSIRIDKKLARESGLTEGSVNKFFKECESNYFFDDFHIIFEKIKSLLWI